MLICPNCQHRQAEGKFCGNCGTALIAEQPTSTGGENQPSSQGFTGGQTEQANQQGGNYQQAPPQQQQVPQQQVPYQQQEQYQQPQQQPTQQENVDKAKQYASNFWHKYVDIIKSPMKSLPKYREDVNFSFIILALFVITISISAYVGINTSFKRAAGIFAEVDNLPFFPLFIRFLVFILIMIGIVYGVMVVVQQAFASKSKAKYVITDYNNLLASLIVINLVGIILGFTGAFYVTYILLFVVLGIAINLNVVIYLTSLLNKFRPDKENVYIIYLSVFAIGIIQGIAFIILGDTLIQDLDNSVNNMFDF